MQEKKWYSEALELKVITKSKVENSVQEKIAEFARLPDRVPINQWLR